MGDNWLKYYKGLCAELEANSLYDAVSKRVDTITEAIEHLGDREHSIVRTALAEIQMLVDAGGAKG